MRERDATTFVVRGFVSLIVVAIFIFASQHAMAPTYWGGTMGGKTEINPGLSGCNADAWVILIQDGVDVELYDYVYIEYHAWWYDNRSSSSSTANHNYTLHVDYRGTTFSDYYDKSTTGDEQGDHWLRVDVYIDHSPPDYLFINWTAKVEGPDLPRCPAEDSGPMQIQSVN